ncbi:MAG: dihydroorotate dehydrogenase electron transfer subunit [Candidatus Omnitrophota bacterium]
MNTLQIDTKIISHDKINKRYYILKLEVPQVFKDAQPGQFVHVRINSSSDPLLRRPFSIHNILVVKTKSNKQKIYLNILYEIKGKGTKILFEKRTGEYLNILGPLGKGFDYQTKNSHNQINFLIAGGAGVAPLYFLANKISHSKSNKSNTNKTVVLIGAVTGANILSEKEFRDLGCEVNLSTDDGTKGFKGKVTDLFEKKLQTVYSLTHSLIKYKAINVYACGPISMLTALTKICLIKKIPLQVSLEEFMGCGIGACLGCAIQTKTGYQRVCHDGPVFNSDDIVWKF